MKCFKSFITNFNNLVINSPHTISIIEGKHHVTYQSLNNRVTHFLRLLQKLKVTRGSVVSILMYNSIDLIAAIISIMKLGGSTLLLDPKTPLERTKTIFEESKSLLLLTDKANKTNLKNWNQSIVIDISSLLNTRELINKSIITEVIIDGMDIAYITYTSGSTGKPKGIAISHHSLCNYLYSIREHYNIYESSHFALFTSISFDLTFTSIFFPLMFGHTLHIFENKNEINITLQNVLTNRHITHLKLTPSHLRIVNNLTSHSLISLKQIIVGGEQFSTQLALATIKKFGNQIKIINEYGPSETTIGASYHFFNENEKNMVVPIGTPIHNITFSIYEINFDLTNSKNDGELYIGGAGVADSYWLNPDLTAASFLPDPVIPGKRIYKTGDLVKTYSNNLWEFIGRVDKQVKLRGYRIELEEIQNLIEKNLLVKECIVSLYSTITGKYFDNNSDKQIICVHLITNNLEIDFDKMALSLKRYLTKKLPSYMIPQFYISINFIPLTNAGKIDYNSLPKPTIIDSNLEVIFDSDVERKIAAVWLEVLGCSAESIQSESNFFELGGDSISAILIVNKCKEYGIQLNASDLFNFPTISQLAMLSKPQNNQIGTKSNNNYNNIVPLSPIQKWFFLTFGNSISTYSQCTTIFSRQLLDKNIIKKVLKRIVKENDGFRLLFPNKTMVNEQYAILTNNINKILKYKSSNILDKEINQEFLEKYFIHMASELNIVDGPTINVYQIDTFNNTYIIFLIHHLIIDAISWKIMLNSFITYYNQIKELGTINIKKNNQSYKKWIQAKEKFWNNQFSFQENKWVDLYNNIQNNRFLDGNQNKFLAKSRKKILLESTVEQTNRIRSLSKSIGLSVRDLLLTAVIYSYTYTDDGEIIIFIEGHGRDLSASEFNSSEIVGWFTEMSPIFMTINIKDSIITLLKKVKKNIDNLSHNKIGYLETYFHGNLTLKPRSIIYPSILFNYLGNISTKLTENFSIKPNATSVSSSDIVLPYPFEINVWITDNKIILNLFYDSENITESFIGKFIERYESVFSYISQENLDNIKHLYDNLQDLAQEPSDLEEIIKELKYRDINDIYHITNLAPMQEALLAYENYGTELRAYYQNIYFTLNGTIEPGLIKDIFQHLVNKHMSLRSIFIYKNISRPKQVILKNALIDFTFYDKDIDKNTLIIQDRFDFSANPPMKILLIKEEKSVYTLIWSFHHILLDGWSLMILFKELLEELQQATKYTSPCSNTYEPQIIDYIKWLNSQNQSKAINYWKEFFLTYDQNALLPKKINRLNNISLGKVTKKNYFLDLNLIEQLKNLAKSYSISIGTLLQSIWGVLLINYCNCLDVIFGTVVSGRNIEVDNIDKMVGLFINTLPVRIKITPENSFVDLIKSIQQQLLNSQKYCFLSPNVIQSFAMQKENVISSLFVIENYPFAGEAENILKSYNLPFDISSIHLEEQTHYDLTITFILQENWKIEIDYDNLAYDDLFIKQIISDYTNICHTVINKPGSKILNLEILSNQDREYLIHNFSTENIQELHNLTISEIFDINLKKAPHRIALVQGNSFLSYKELDERSSYLAQYLIDIGVNLEQPIGIMQSRTFNRVITWLAVLKSGGAYVPLDPNLAQEKLIYIINDSHINLLLTDSDNFQRISSSNIDLKVLKVDQLFPAIINKYIDNPLRFPKVSVKNLAYIIYTSGSTGLPKGVAMQYDAIYNHFIWMSTHFNMTKTDTMLQLLNFAVDTALTELYIILIGGQLVILENSNMSIDLINLENTIKKNKVTILQLVPSLLELILKNRLNICRTVRLLLCGAEVLNKQIQFKFNEYYNHIDLVNIYGLTETCIDSTYYHCNNLIQDNDYVPIGRPITNTKIYIMNSYANLASILSIGELYVGGVGLARGYYKKPDLTASKFIPDPFCKGARIYMTGDFARFDSKKNVIYLGRSDMQVKIRGYRVELQEIEKVITKYPNIQKAVVKVFGDLQSEKFLCVYFTALDKLDSDLIKRFCLQELNNYMVPRYIIQLEEFPLTLNGKVDYDKLVQPSLVLEQDLSFMELGDLEQKLIKIWANVLNVPIANIYLYSNFFDIGGNSILLIQLHSYICQNIDLNVSIQDLFLYPTVSSFCSYIRNKINYDNSASELKKDLDERAKNRKFSFSKTLFTKAKG